MNLRKYFLSKNVVYLFNTSCFLGCVMTFFSLFVISNIAIGSTGNAVDLEVKGIYICVASGEYLAKVKITNKSEKSLGYAVNKIQGKHIISYQDGRASISQNKTGDIFLIWDGVYSYDEILTASPDEEIVFFVQILVYAKKNKDQDDFDGYYLHLTIKDVLSQIIIERRYNIDNDKVVFCKK